MANIDEIEKAEEKSDARYKIDYVGILYTAVYSAVTSISGGAVMSYSGVIASGGAPLAVLLVFVTQLVPKLAKEMERKRAINQAREEAYMSGVLENRKRTTKLFHSLMQGCGRASAF